MWASPPMSSTCKYSMADLGNHAVTQHLCLSAHLMVYSLPFLGLLGLLEGFWRAMVVISYVVVLVWLHFRVYNNNMKPTLLEMIVLFLLVAVMHISAIVVFLKLLGHAPPGSTMTATHGLVRRFFHQ